ncbi:glycoside hydrolase family 10 protein [Ruminococcus champanellensis]|uniref:glycoside hydrolase family 10 protein n=1 Tax=Ruminococcus champanellensis TaxID=1161942 RepID=UPI0026DC5513|nr:family 10 glycosylhydrolase [Ruminococcus champanellensis]
MKQYICLLAVFLMGCTPGTGRITPGMGMRLELQEQTAEQLHLPVQQSGSPVVAAWLTAVSLSDMLKGATEAAYRAAVHQELTWLCENGFTDVFVQVRSNGDAYYRSRVYPRAASWSQDFDPFQVFLEENQQVGLQVHAWINPYRCQTAGQMLKIPDTYPTRMWAQEQAESIVQVSGRWYLNPADAHAQALICTGAQELLDGYDIAGLHIDDYFYPTTEPELDAAAFAASRSEDLTAWRTEQVNTLVAALYAQAHAADRIFSISPRGDPAASAQLLYADPETWCSQSGYCDWILPQLYYGFDNETCGFAEMLALWQGMVQTDGVRLIPGICTYKVGQADDWAGTGRMEWLTEQEIPARQAAAVLETGLNGVAVYSSASTRELDAPEMEALKQQLCRFTQEPP